MDGGCVYLVGAGPGDPDLLTVRGAMLLGQADAVVFDRLANERLLEHARPDARRIYVGKEPGQPGTSQADINELLVSLGRAGMTVVRLKGGDPCVFGRAGEEAAALADAGVRFEIVPGVSAGLAAAAYAGIIATDRRLSSAVALVAAREDDAKDAPTLDYASLASFGGTLIFYMGVAAMRQVTARLLEHGMAPATPAAVVQNGTLGSQRTVDGTLADIADAASRHRVEPPAVLILGPTVSSRGRINWFERRALLNKRIVNTRPLAQSQELSRLLEDQGADVIHAPAIFIAEPKDHAPAHEAVRQLGRYDWLILTSTNGVDALMKYLGEAGLDSRALGRCRVCAIGPATAARLGRHGVRADAQPDTFTSRSIVELLVSMGQIAGARVLCPRAENAPESLIDGLRDAGATVDQIVTYRTVSDNRRAHELRNWLAAGTIDWITFTSPSIATSLVKDVPAELIRSSRAHLASIGPTTSAALRKLGLEPTVEAPEHTSRGLVAAILAKEGAVAT